MFYRIVVLKEFPRKPSSQVVFFNVQYIYFKDMMTVSENLT